MLKATPENNNLLFKTMKWLLIVVTIFLLLLTAVGALALVYPSFYQQRFFPGVSLNGQSLNNLTKEQAAIKLQKAVDEFLQNGLTYNFNNQEIKIALIQPSPADPDLARKLVDFKIAESVDKALAVGRSHDFFKNFKEQLGALIFKKKLPLEYEFYQEEFLAIIQNNLQKYITPKVDAYPQFNEDQLVEIIPEKVGTNFDYQLILKQTTASLNNLAIEPITLNLITEQPSVKKAEISADLIRELSQLVATSSLSLFYQKDSWPVASNIFRDWLIFKKVENEVVLGLAASPTTKYLQEVVAGEINQPAYDAKFNIKNGRVMEFQGSQDGWELDLEKSISQLAEELFKNNNYKIELAVNQLKSKISTASVNDLGITEIIGTGQSNFAGSPKNRRHNISVGAASLNGILIKPGEEFSLIKALGKVDEKSGYKPELVIKGDRTIPEYGGGLCQIGTTVFRAALASGLPITERRAHSYRVVYYEPAGKDATIYDPKPDLKFINDTGNYILIQARIVGDNLYFDFWGTKDGRTAEQTDSVIYNIKSPGPTQYIETEELAAGEKNCIEKSHNGADAYFDYKVTYAGGEVKETRFTSHYIPWPAKCLVGKELESVTPSSTPETLVP